MYETGLKYVYVFEEEALPRINYWESPPYKYRMATLAA